MGNSNKKPTQQRGKNGGPHILNQIVKKKCPDGKKLTSMILHEDYLQPTCLTLYIPELKQIMVLHIFFIGRLLSESGRCHPV